MNNQNIRVLVYGDNGGSGGYIHYCKGLLGSGVIPNDIDIIFVSSTSFYEMLKPLDESVKVVHHSWPSSSSRLHRYLWHLFLYPEIVKKYSPDVEYYPSGQLRVFGRRACTVTGCRNLLLFDSMELTRFTNSRYFEKYRDRQLKSFLKASGVIFLSDYSRDLVLRSYPSIKSSCVIPSAVERLEDINNRPSFSIGLQVNMLYVSPVYPYKHHKEVIQAVKILRMELNKELRLRLVGGGSVEFVEDLKTFISQENAFEFIDLINYLDYSSTLSEYRTADIFIFASSCEAFPRTLLEAMAAHLPIVCSERTGLPDILRDAAEYFNPEDPRSIANALGKLISNEEYRKKLGEKAYRYSLEFTRERTAQQTFKFIRQIAEQHTS